MHGQVQASVSLAPQWRQAAAWRAFDSDALAAAALKGERLEGTEGRESSQALVVQVLTAGQAEPLQGAEVPERSQAPVADLRPRSASDQ